MIELLHQVLGWLGLLLRPVALLQLLLFAAAPLAVRLMRRRWGRSGRPAWIPVLLGLALLALGCLLLALAG